MPALFALRSPAMSFTGLVPETVLDDHDHGELEPLRKRLRLTISRTDAPSPCAFFIPKPQECGVAPWFAFICANGAIGVACFHQQPSDSNLMHIGQNIFKIYKKNGTPSSVHFQIGHGDILALTFQGPIRAGGHHAGGPHALAPGATFGARCEFAVNTSGWIAIDEVTFWVQHVQWTAPGYAYFSMPVLWDDAVCDFDFGLQAEFAIPNNKLRAHWCAVEVNRASHLVTVVVLGLPGPYFHTVVAAVARLLDFHPSRLAASTVALPDFPHMCGWILLDRWIRAAGLQDELPPINDGFEQVSLEKRG